jgi:hypothetical protein
MRRLWSILALVVVLAGLGSYIYFVTWKQDADTPASKAEKVFAGAGADKVNELTVHSESGDVTTVKKDGDTWKVVSPITARASDSDISAVTGAIAQLEVVKVIDDNPTTGLKEYGLDTPKLQVEFKSSDGKAGKILIGEKTATGSNLYAKRNDERRVFLIPQYQEASLNKSAFDLRDKAIMSLQHDKVGGVEVVADGKSMVFSKSGSVWTFVKPLAARADYSAVEGILGRIETAQMKSVVTNDPTPADLKKYGLDKPAATVNINMGGDRASFVVGGKADDDTVYARDGSKPAVVTVEKSLAEDLKKTVDDYRRHDIFESRAFSSTHVEITRGGQKLVLDRVKGQGDAGDTWHRASPNPGEADKEKVNKTLADLADINVTAFQSTTAKTGLEKPDMVISVKFDDGKKSETITFGKSGADIFASRPDEPGAEKVEGGKYSDAVKEVDELLK